MAETFQLPVLRACRLADLARSTWYKQSTARDQSALRLRIRELAHARPRFGYLRIHVLLQREGWTVAMGFHSKGEIQRFTELVHSEHLKTGLIGTLTGLGMLARSSEITVMRAVGLSPFQIAQNPSSIMLPKSGIPARQHGTTRPSWVM